MIHLHPATPDDIPAIRDLAHRIWWTHYPGIISTEQIEYMLEWMYGAETLERQMTLDGHHFWLIRYAGESIGFIAISQKAPGDYFMHKFYLDAGRQAKGLGTAAFHTLLEQYPGLRTLRLTVNRRNYKSVNFYFKNGFTIEKCVDIPIGRGFVMDDFQMIRSTPPPSRL